MLSFNRFLIPGKLLYSCKRNCNVAVVGANSELGKTVSMLLRAEPGVSQLCIYDNEPSQVYKDLLHIISDGKLKSYHGWTGLLQAVRDADIVLATGGLPTTPGVDAASLATTNTPFIKSVAAGVARCHPAPFIGIATEPIDSMVPIAAEVIKCNGHYDSRKLFGISGVHALRARMMYAAINHIDPNYCTVPVIGGHSPRTMLPLLSQAQPFRSMEESKMRRFVKELRDAEKVIVASKNGEPAVLSQAHGVLQFARAAMVALSCTYSPTLDAFVENNDFGTEFFGGRVTVDMNGIREMERYTNLSEFECDLLEKYIKLLRSEVVLGKRILEAE